MDFRSLKRSLKFPKISRHLQISKISKFPEFLKNAQISRNSRKIWKIISGHLYREIDKISKSRSRFSEFGLKPRSKYFQNLRVTPFKILKLFSDFGTKNVPKSPKSRNREIFRSLKFKISGPKICRSSEKLILENSAEVLGISKIS